VLKDKKFEWLAKNGWGAVAEIEKHPTWLAWRDAFRTFSWEISKYLTNELIAELQKLYQLNKLP